MSIHEFPDEQFPEESGNNTNMDGLDLIFKLIALLASGFSGYTTYLGFDYDFPKLMAITLAVMVGLGLLMINFKLRQSRIVGESVGKILLALLFVLPFSFISNTNAIYTFFMEKDVVEKTQIEAWKNFDAGTSKLLAAIEDHEISIKVARIKQSLDIARRNLKEQLTNRREPGLGVKAQRHLEKIETILGTTLTKLKPPPYSAEISQHREYAERLDQLILSQYELKFNIEKNKKIRNLKEKTVKLRGFYESKIGKKIYSRDTTDLMENDLQSLLIEAKNTIEFKGEVMLINTASDDIGALNYTLDNFIYGINLSSIILSIFLALMLDFFTPILSLLLYRPDLD